MAGFTIFPFAFESTVYYVEDFKGMQKIGKKREVGTVKIDYQNSPGQSFYEI